MGKPNAASWLKGRWESPVAGYLFISPWLVGFLGLTLYPMVMSLYYAFTNFSLLEAPEWVGWTNYQLILTNDDTFVKSLKVTLLEGYSWVNDPRTALGTLVVLVVWQFGSSMVIFLAGLKQIPRDFYEAASVDGASKTRQFFRITLPSPSPIILFNLVLQTIGSFQMFTQALS